MIPYVVSMLPDEGSHLRPREVRIGIHVVLHTVTCADLAALIFRFGCNRYPAGQRIGTVTATFMRVFGGVSGLHTCVAEGYSSVILHYTKMATWSGFSRVK